MSAHRTRAEYRMIAAPGDPAHTLKPAAAIATAQGFVMVRRPNCRPFVVTDQEWADAPLQGK